MPSAQFPENERNPGIGVHMSSLLQCTVFKYYSCLCQIRDKSI